MFVPPTIHHDDAGLPIRPVFSKPLPAKKAMKKALGLRPDLPAVLLVGGGEGMGQLEVTVDQIAEKLGGICQVGGRGRDNGYEMGIGLVFAGRHGRGQRKGKEKENRCRFSLKLRYLCLASIPIPSGCLPFPNSGRRHLRAEQAAARVSAC